MFLIRFPLFSSTTSEEEKIKLLNDYIKILEKQLEDKENLQKELNEYKTANIELAKENIRLLDLLQTAHNNGRAEAIQETEKLLLKVFTPGQVTALITNKRINWQPDDIASAMALHSTGAKAYKFIREVMGIPLPCNSTLRRWAQRISCLPGLQTDVLKLMKLKRDCYTTLQAQLVLSFDEVKISSKYCYDKGLDQVQGPYNNAQVVMIRALFGNYKQPIYYNFDQVMTKEIFNEIVTSLFDIGYKVVATVSDMGGSNRGLWSSLGIDINNVSIAHPKDSESNIYFFADAPHLLKLMRNHFIDDGFIINGEHLTKKILEQTLQVITENKNEVRLAHKLNDSLLTVTKRGRQRVRPAAQLWSQTNSAAVSWCGARGLLADPNWQQCSNVIGLINHWFDIMNRRSMRPNGLPCQQAYGMSLEEQNKVLSEMIDFMTELRIPRHKSMLHFQKGIIMSSRALPLLHKEMCLKHTEVSYILTYRLNQDLLENFFAQIRSAGITYTNPLPTEFKYRFRKHILAKNPECIVNKSNCQNDETETLPVIDHLNELPRLATVQAPIPHDDPNSDTEFFSVTVVDGIEIENGLSENDVILPDEEIQFPLLNENFDEDEVSTQNIKILTTPEIVQLEGMRYLAGYMAKRLRTTNPELGHPTGQLEINSNNDLPDWISTLSEGGLIQPNLKFLSDVLVMERLFNEFHGTEFNRCMGCINQLCNIITSKVGCEKSIAHLFARTRLFIRIRYFNSELTAKSRSVEDTNYRKFYS